YPDRLQPVAGLVLRGDHLQFQVRLAEHVDLQRQRCLHAIRSIAMTIARKIMARAKSIFAIAFTMIALSLASPAAFAQNAQDTQATSATIPQQQASQMQDEQRNTLSQYGRFVQHQKYGEVWVPTVTPQAWHPYPPCHWVNTKQYGWYYDD